MKGKHNDISHNIPANSQKLRVCVCVCVCACVHALHVIVWEWVGGGDRHRKIKTERERERLKGRGRENFKEDHKEERTVEGPFYQLTEPHPIQDTALTQMLLMSSQNN